VEPPRTNLLRIDDAMIEALATNRTVIANFASCFGAFTRTPACGKCGHGARRGTGDYADVRDCIGGLPPAKKLLLKRLLNANKIRLFVRHQGGRQELTF
jgi:hypothetical protein